MRNETNIHYCKLTIFKLVDQFGFRCMKDDKPAFSDLCESALEWAFNALGFEEDVVYAEDFYAEYDKAWKAYCDSEGYKPPMSMVDMFNNRTEPWVYSWEYEDIDEDEIAENSGYIPFNDGGY